MDRYPYNLGPNMYDRFSVQPGATRETIVAAYKDLSKQLHPDKKPGRRDTATRLFKQVKEARDTLIKALDKGIPIPAARY